MLCTPELHIAFFSSNAGGSWSRRGKKSEGSVSQMSFFSLFFKKREIKKRFDHSDGFLLIIIVFARAVMSSFTESGHLVVLHSCILKWIKIKSLT